MKLLSFFIATLIHLNAFAQSPKDSATGALAPVLSDAAGKEKHMKGFSFRTVDKQHLSADRITVEESDYDYGTNTTNTKKQVYENIPWTALKSFEVSELLGEKANDLNRFKVKSWPKLNDLEIYEMGGGNVVASVDLLFTTPLKVTKWENGKETFTNDKETTLTIYCRLKEIRRMLWLVNRLRKA